MLNDSPEDPKILATTQTDSQTDAGSELNQALPEEPQHSERLDQNHPLTFQINVPPQRDEWLPIFLCLVSF